MKILIAVEHLFRGGRERRIIELLKGLVNYDNIEFEVVMFKDIIDYEEFYDLNIPLHILHRKSKKDLSVFTRFYKLLKQTKPDVVHSWGGFSSLISLPCAKLLGIKTINAMITNSFAGIFSENWIRSRLTFPFSDIIASNSEAGLRAYKPPKRKAVKIYNGFSLDRIKKLTPIEEIRKNLGVNTPKLVVMIGAFQPRKDHRTYISAAIEILNKRNDVTFLSIGDGPHIGTVKNYVPDNLKNKILFPGNINDIESVINVIDIGVLTTNKDGGYAEGISNAILEYMALGKPVIATNDGGSPEIVKESISGFLIPTLDTELLIEKISYLLDNPDIAKKMGEEGKKIVYENFTIESMLKTTYNLYQKLNNTKNEA